MNIDIQIPKSEILKTCFMDFTVESNHLNKNNNFNIFL